MISHFYGDQINAWSNLKNKKEKLANLKFINTPLLYCKDPWNLFYFSYIIWY